MKAPDVSAGSGAGSGRTQAAREMVVDRSIGQFIREVRNLDDEQIEQILIYQRNHNLRFGEAAIALKLASSNDVLWALSRQFHYPYATEGDVVGFDDELIAAIDPFSDQAEIFRDIRSQLLAGVMSGDKPHQRSLAVLSPSVGDGKTFFAANLAVTFSQLEGRTLLVDADMRTPRLHRLFGVSDRAGLSGILAGHTEAEVIQQIHALPNLYLLPVGTVPPNPLELLQRPAFGLLMHELCAKFDHVIVDTPAASHGADARVLAARCGAALVMGRRGKTQMDALQSLISQVHKNQVKFAGVMINDH
ncbi:MAG: polysaccharide biosynthesis tyrosine autokinase [Rhizobacter sp.]